MMSLVSRSGTICDIWGESFIKPQMYKLPER
jgi:hypothetical protein